MTRWFADAPLHRKLAALIFGGSVVVLALATGVFAAIEVWAAHRDEERALRAVAQILAFHVAPSVAFDDRESAGELLASLRRHPDVEWAVLYGPDGRVFAVYVRGPAGAAPPEGLPGLPPPPGFRAGGLEVVWPVELEGEPLGRLRVRSDLGAMRARLRRYGYVAASAFAGAVCLAALVAWMLQRLVSEPIRALAGLVERVAREADYGVRAPEGGRDEVGTLVRGVNHMLAQIEARDRALRRHRDHLEERVRQRTAELERARDAAERANRAKSRFLALVSHELRTPLNAILGNAALLAESGLPREQKERVDTIAGAARHLVSLIDDLLDVGGIEAGHIRMVYGPYDPGALAQEVGRLFQDAASRKGLELAVEVGGHTPREVTGDRVRVRQVLSNLVDNAIKFTAKGRVTLRVEASGDRLRYEVEDTGPGIPPNARERVFLPFERAEPAHRRSHGGAGLGLTICKRLVERMGGRIGMESRPGRGSRFWVELPLGVEAVAGPPSVRHPAAGGRRVLVVEDNAVNRELLRAMLEQAGCEVAEAQTGAEALERLEREAFDVVFMDCQLPGMDGFETVERLRRRERETGRPRAYVVACTAYASREARQQCLASGMDRVLVKPIEPEAVWAVLQPAGEPPLDPEPLERIRKLEAAGRPGLVRRVVELYLAESERLVRALEEACRADDPMGAARAAHALRSSSLNVGARAVADACRRVEHGAGREPAGDLVARIRAVRSAWEQAVEALKRWPMEGSDGHAGQGAAQDPRGG